jgi:hypothetical protein
VQLSDGSNLTLANVMGIPHYILALSIAGVALVVIWYLNRRTGEAAEQEEGGSLFSRIFNKEAIFKRGWGWKATGIVIGCIGILAFYASTEAGRSYPLAITGGYLTVFKSLILGQNYISWLSVMLLSTIVGAFIAAILSGEFRLRAPAPKVILQSFLGGCLMGFGAVCSAGCNITHILSGVPQLALSSILGGAFLILGCWAAAWWLFIRPMRAAGI